MRADTRSFVLLSVRRFTGVVNLGGRYPKKPPDKRPLLPDAALLLTERGIELLQLRPHDGMLRITQ